jgi:hypothetical protein
MKTGSFAERNPILAIIAIVGFTVFAGVPMIAMLSESFACKINAVDPWCPEVPGDDE